MCFVRYLCSSASRWPARAISPPLHLVPEAATDAWEKNMVALLDHVFFLGAGGGATCSPRHTSSWTSGRMQLSTCNFCPVVSARLASPPPPRSACQQANALPRPPCLSCGSTAQYTACVNMHCIMRLLYEGWRPRGVGRPSQALSSALIVAACTWSS